MKFDLSFQRVPKLLYETVQPTPLKDPKIIAVSGPCMDLFGDNSFDNDVKALGTDQLTRWLDGQIRLPGDQRISTRYAGHQFGVWAGQLGDGRAISLGEILNGRGERWEIQTKGSGLTPFSRMGDGKAVIRSSVREFLCSEAMHALGIPTTRALALITGNDQVQREHVERSALVARVFPSNLRFGHFEYCFHFGHKDELKQLCDYAQKYFFSDANSPAEMLEEVTLRTADLIAAWQAVGFCHGVMNTDNMSFLGLTIDYGPFGFLEDTQLDHICNHSDHTGRYSYFQQPQIALWNLERLLTCFVEIVDRAELERILGLFPGRFEESWLGLFRKKLGLTKLYEPEEQHQNERQPQELKLDKKQQQQQQQEPGQQEPQSDTDFGLVAHLLKVLHTNQIDFTFFFRCLCDYESGQLGSLEKFWEHYPHLRQTKQSPESEALSPSPSTSQSEDLTENLLVWLKIYDQRLKKEMDNVEGHQQKNSKNSQSLQNLQSLQNRSQTMKNINPKYILRNYIAEEIIQSVERDEVGFINQWLNILSSPFDEHKEMERYSHPTEETKKNIVVSCSS